MTDFREAVKDYSGGKMDERQAAQKIIEQIIKMAADGNYKAASKLLGYIYGKEVQGLELSGPDGAAIPQEIKIKSVKAKNDKST